MRKLALGLGLALLALLPITIYAKTTRSADVLPPANFTVLNPAPSPTPEAVSSPTIPKPAQTAPKTNAQPAPYAQLWVDTPIYAQGSLLGGVACAPTAVSMVMGHYASSGHPAPTPEQLINLVGPDKVIPGQGIPYNSMLPAIDKLGYHNLSGHTYTSAKELADDLESGPVIITAGVDFNNGALEPGSSSHSLVVIGVATDGSRYTVQDPYLGNRVELSASTFNQIWAGGSYGIFVMRP